MHTSTEGADFSAVFSVVFSFAVSAEKKVAHKKVNFSALALHVETFSQLSAVGCELRGYS